MKPTLLLAALILAFAFAITAQTNKTAKVSINENKYRINLPDYWGHGNKVWEILTEKLPLVSEELKGKDICGDNCKPKYIVDFYITEPELVGYTRNKKSQPPSTNTTFLANKLPGISLNTPVNNYIMSYPFAYYTSGSNVQGDNWEMTGQYVFQCFLLLRDDTGHIVTKFILVDDNEVWPVKFKGDRASYNPSQNPDVFFEKNKDDFTPGKFEMLGIVDKKILAL